MSTRVWAAATAAVLLSAGCDAGGMRFGGGDAVEPPPAAAEGKFYAGPALWDDPQNAPHPAYNWSTLSNPTNHPDRPLYWAPPEPRALPDAIGGIDHVAQVEGVEQGAGMALFGRLGIVPGGGTGSYLVDIGDPTQPKLLNRFHDDKAMAKCMNEGESDGQAAGPTHRGAATIAYPNGRLLTVFATSSVLDVWDISDPHDPFQVTHLRPKQGSHKVGVVPGTPIVYNAASAGGGNFGAGTGFTEIFDLSDPEDPEYVQDFHNGFSCHHVYFWNRPEENKYRAVCAGVEYTQIWDTANPREPKVIVSIPVHHGIAGTPSTGVVPLIFSHYAGLSRDGKVLMVGDEMGGGALPPGCAVSVNTPAGAVSTPVGAVWFYDVSDETNPLLLGWYSAHNDPLVKTPLGTCTAHHGRLVPDAQGRDLLAMSFYGDGVILIDFSNPRLPKSLGQFVDDSVTWETWYHNGYLFTGDLARGMDVLSFR